MVDLLVELVTDNRCTGPECEKCDEANELVAEVTMSGVARVLNRLGFQTGRNYRVRHLSCEELEADWLRGHRLPLIRLDGRIILEGPSWTEAEVREALNRALQARPVEAS